MTSKKDLDAELKSMMGKLHDEGVLQLQEMQVQLKTQESIEPPVQWVSTTTSEVKNYDANTRTHFP